MSLVKDQIIALYIAVYGRAPDTAGMNYWMQEDSYANAASGFVSHQVFLQEYAGDTNRQMVEKFYTNIFGSIGDAEGINYWTAELDKGDTVHQVLAGFLQAALTVDVSDNPEGLARQNTLKNKITVADYYQKKLGGDFSLAGIDPKSADIVNAPDYIQARQAIENITASNASVTKAKNDINKIVDLGKSDTTTIKVHPQDWSSWDNWASFTLEFDSALSLEQIYLLGGGTTHLNTESTTKDGVTTVVVGMSFSNGKKNGSIGLDLSVPSSLKGKEDLKVKAFNINGTQYPDVTKTVGSNDIEFKFSDLIAPFTLINETVNLDSSGYDYLIYNNINDVLSLPDARAGLIEAGNATKAYLHIAEGESFQFDHDTFVLRSDSTANYRLKFTPEDPSLFGSNVISKVYRSDGSWDTSIMNFIGDSSTFVDGGLYSSPFSLQAGQDKFLTLSMRWNDVEDVWATASGPAGYQVELVEVVGVSGFVDTADVDWLA